MWAELQHRLRQSTYAGLLDEATEAIAIRLLDELLEREPALAHALYDRADDADGQALWRGLLASEFLRHALLAEAPFALRWLHDDSPPNCDGDDSLTALIGASGVVSGLRRHRRRQMLVIGWLDIAGRMTLAQTLAALSDLADRSLRAALREARQRMQARHGELRATDGSSVSLYAICMGKLGGRELNFSSDIDLIFAYDRDGESDGPRPLAASEYCLREARHVIELIDSSTEEGRVFRVDTRLRPFGEAGPLAVSLSSLEDYLQEHGRDWERYAFIKARFIGSSEEAARDPAVVRFSADVLRPFVYRRYLDFGVLSSLRDMKQMIAREVARRDMRDHLKLGPGGIREIEFIAQSWQLIRGGQVAQLRTTSLQAALQAAADSGCMSAAVVEELWEAYALLRRTENRLQALADRQTHRLPDASLARNALALAMHADDWPAMVSALNARRDAVSSHFGDLLFSDDNDAAVPAHEAWLEESPAALHDALDEHGVEDAADVANALLTFREHLARVPLEHIARERLDRFVDSLMQQLAGREKPALIAERALQVATAVLRRSAYLSLLNEQPDALRRLLQLCAASSYLAAQLAEYPMLIDELIDARLFSQPLGKSSLGDELDVLFEERQPGDAEAAMQVLVRFARTVWFRIAVADCSGEMPIMRVSDHLSAVAELILERTLSIAWDDVTAITGVPAGADAARPRFAIIAYGKLGGLELGYGSDLDIVFLHDLPEGETDGPRPLDSGRFAIRLATRIVHFLGVQTGHGRLFEVDTRLRPSGRSGLLVSTLAAFRRYQQSDAWTWEHQALTRARPVAGDAGVRADFEAIRCDVLVHNVQRDGLADQVLTMRARMRRELSRAGSGQFDIKQDAGGITDIEFFVQYLLLAHAGDAPALLDWRDNIRQLDSLAEAGLLDPDVAAALQEIYRQFRQRVHRLALDRKPPIVADSEFAAQRDTVRTAWRSVFGETSPAAGAEDP